MVFNAEIHELNEKIRALIFEAHREGVFDDLNRKRMQELSPTEIRLLKLWNEYHYENR